MDLWITGMTYGSSTLENSKSRDEKVKGNLESRNGFALLKNKEEVQTETENKTL